LVDVGYVRITVTRYDFLRATFYNFYEITADNRDTKHKLNDSFNLMQNLFFMISLSFVILRCGDQINIGPKEQNI
jgi:hypothetical protein